MNDRFEMLRELHRRYHNLDYTPQRAAVNREYVALADQLARPYEQVSGRYDLAWAYAMGDDPAKALPVCAEFFALLEQHPPESWGRIRRAFPSAPPSNSLFIGGSFDGYLQRGRMQRGHKTYETKNS